MIQQFKEEAKLLADRFWTTNDYQLAELNDLIDKVYIQAQKDILDKVYFRYNPEKTHKEVIEQCNILNNPLSKNY